MIAAWGFRLTVQLHVHLESRVPPAAVNRSLPRSWLTVSSIHRWSSSALHRSRSLSTAAGAASPSPQCRSIAPSSSSSPSYSSSPPPPSFFPLSNPSSRFLSYPACLWLLPQNKLSAVCFLNYHSERKKKTTIFFQVGVNRIQKGKSQGWFSWILSSCHCFELLPGAWLHQRAHSISLSILIGRPLDKIRWLC